MNNLIYLASQSPRRRDLLKEYRYPFRVISSIYEEKPLKNARPSRLVTEHAQGKVLHAQVKGGKPRFVLGADTVVYCQGQTMGKPKSLSEACRMMGTISGNWHTVYTGMYMLDLLEEKDYLGYEKTKVYIKKMNRSEIKEYFDQVSPFDKAGSYGIQCEPNIIEKTQGSFSNVMGLPMERLSSWLKKANKKNVKRKV